MTRHRLRPVVSVWLIVAAGAALSAQGPIGRSSSPTGTAVVAGRVVADGEGSAPIRRAAVTLDLSEGTGTGFTAVTEDDGTFRFAGVPAGRYQLTARKAGFIRTSFGATRPGRPGTPIAVVAGSERADFVVRLTRGAVITGTITDTLGDPASDVEVQVHRVHVVDGARQLDSRDAARTDDRGVYRFFDLPAGDFVVTGVRSIGHGPVDSVRPIGAAEVQWANRELQAGGRAGGSPPPDAASVGYAPIFFPGTTSAERAQVITLASGVERAGVDFALQLVPVARLRGTVVKPDGSPAPAQLYLMPAGATPGFGFGGLRESHGPEFSFVGLTPGSYTLTARSSGNMHDRHVAEATVRDEAASRETTPPPAMWATTTVTVGPGDLTGVTLTLQPALTVAGRVAVDATTRRAPDLTAARVRLTPIAGEQRLTFMAIAEIQRDGRFTVSNVMPGDYQLAVELGGGPETSDWTVRSIRAGDRTLTDLPMEITADRTPTELVVTMTDRATALRGSLVTAENRPAPDFYVIAFPADRAYWTRGSRRVQAVRPATDGGYLFKSLPPGDYLLAALTDVENDEWHDRAFLEQLIAGALKLRVVEGTTTVQDVRIGRGTGQFSTGGGQAWGLERPVPHLWKTDPSPCFRQARTVARAISG